jgi:hypothetical protein
MATAVTMLALPMPAAAATLTGPQSVKPGSVVKFVGYGYRPSSRVRILLQPGFAEGGNGFAAAVDKRFTVRPSGRVVMRFRFPRRYSACSGVGNCDRRRWRPGSRAVVNAYSADGYTPADRKYVRIRRY